MESFFYIFPIGLNKNKYNYLIINRRISLALFAQPCTNLTGCADRRCRSLVRSRYGSCGRAGRLCLTAFALRCRGAVCGRFIRTLSVSVGTASTLTLILRITFSPLWQALRYNVAQSVADITAIRVETALPLSGGGTRSGLVGINQPEADRFFSLTLET